MNRFILELRRREVFRTAGLYVGVCWIAIEAASVLLPAFDAPDWIMRALVIVAVVGFPVMLVLAWVYDVSDSGIVVQADAGETMVPPLGSRRMDFIVIGVLVVALVLSVYMNLRTDPDDIEPPEPVSVLIADFDNQTGDPLFEGTIEQALSIGIEGASFITAFGRVDAKNLLDKFSPGASLDAAGARLVAVREGIKIVISGSIAEDDGKYELQLSALRPEDGSIASDSSVTAKDKLGVLAAVSQLADDVRSDLGDTTTEGTGSVVGETFTATSLEALQNYTRAQELMISAQYAESLPYYEAALEEDPEFARALSGSALSLFQLGRQQEAEERWQQAVSKMDSMTERERYRTLGLYYVAVTGNFEKGIESYTNLVEKYPSDSAGFNNLAVAHFYTLDLDSAREAGRKALEIYPTNTVNLSNSALYAMYAGDFAVAEQQARELLELDESHFTAWLPIAMAAAAAGDIDAALASYDSMSETGSLGASLARLGKADLAQFSGDFDTAAALTLAGIENHATGLGQRMLAANFLLLAQAQHSAGNNELATVALQQALQTSSGSSTRAAAALVHLDLGNLDMARSLGDELSGKLQSHSRAYGKLVEGLVAMKQGENVAAIDAIRAGIEFADLWLLRFYLGRAYLEAGFFAEAVDEFMSCRKRQGEATAIFLDDLPTWHYISTLPYWLGRAQQSLGMTDAARASFEQFVAYYNADDSLAQDAKERISP